MLTVTDSALQQLHETITQADTNTVDDACFRMIAQDDNTIGLSLQTPAEGDTTFEYEGEPVLAMPKILVEPLSKRILDIDERGHLVLLPRAS